ncbi:CDGSH iron-sulfur domain-containing protein [Streptomyces sp. NPDC004959]|uniref:CDGSH iron-sulfur domain-containing protein n=1 Tax=Streptomyces sp. NPDC004959 TaxID=3154673 RepID=UPI0033BCEF29
MAGGVAAREGSGARRVTIDREGPLLIEGPVEVVMEDGTVAVSDRFVVAVCTCRRSRSYPWCDTSHRRHARPARRPRGKEARRDDDR